MSSITCASVKPSYHVHRQSKLTTKRHTRGPVKIRSSVEPVKDIIIEYESKPEHTTPRLVSRRFSMVALLCRVSFGVL